MPNHSLTWAHLGSCVDLDALVVVVVPAAVVGLDKVAVVVAVVDGVAVVAPELVVKDPADVEDVDAVGQTVVIAFDTVAPDHL